MRDVAQALRTLFIFSLAGMGVSAYGIVQHYGVVSGAPCTIGEAFNCDVVNQSIYSEVFGIPVALLGLLGYAFLAVAALLRLREAENRMLSKLLLLASGIAVLFSLYLTSIEAFVLYTWCIVCLTSLFLIVGIFFLSLYVWRKT